jgi:sn-glycerol 3-phosphate transport system substrate-binding protein
MRRDKIPARSTVSRRGLLTAAGVGAAALATGCGGNTYTQVIGSVPRDYRDRIHLVFWHSFGGGLGEAFNKLIGEFNDSQSEIYIESQFQGTYENAVQKLSASLVARQVPDMVILSEVTWRKMHLANRLEPLDAELRRVAARLGDTVGVEHKRVAGAQVDGDVAQPGVVEQGAIQR